MHERTKNTPHVRALGEKQVAEFRNTTTEFTLLPELLDSATGIPLFIASFPFGSKIATWFRPNTQEFIFHSPCGARLCAECKKLEASLLAGPPIAIVLKNSVEVSAGTTSYAAQTGQQSTVPIEILDAGQILGLRQVIFKALGTKTAKSHFEPKPQRLTATAGARSVHLTIPMNHQEFNDRIVDVLGLEEAYEQVDLSSLRFNDDHWVPLRLLGAALNKTVKAEDQWSVDLLLMPHAVVAQALKNNPALKSKLLEIAASESEAAYQSQWIAGRLAERASTSDQNAEIRTHFHELLQIFCGQRLAFSPAQNDRLGPFSEIQKLLQSLMYTRTLRGRMPGVIVPEVFNRTSKTALYYSFQRVTAQVKCSVADRPAQIMRALAHKAETFKKLLNIPTLHFDFFASEKCPQSFCAISPVAGSNVLQHDFATQLDSASEYGLNSETALGDPRGGFLSRFLRVSV